jgi:hypothetical protein
MKLCSIHLLFGALLSSSILASSARADAVVATSFVETSDAVYFTPAEHDTIVYYFPRLTYVLEEFPTGSRRFRAIVNLASPDFPDNDMDEWLNDLHSGWGDKALLPYQLTAAESCSIQPTTSMTRVQQQTDMLGKTIFGNSKAALCQYSFRLPTTTTDAEVEELQENLEEIISAPLQLTLNLGIEIGWSDLCDAVQFLGPDSGPWSRDGAINIVYISLKCTPGAEKGFAQLTENEQTAFLAEALQKLFDIVASGDDTDDTPMYRLRASTDAGVALLVKTIVIEL